MNGGDSDGRALILHHAGVNGGNVLKPRPTRGGIVDDGSNKNGAGQARRRVFQPLQAIRRGRRIRP
jgi:hypothetical protein